MSRREATTVLGLPNNAEQMGKLIEILRGKTNGDFYAFCARLREYDYEHWADRLEEKAREFKGEPGTHTGEGLEQCIFYI